MLTVLGSLHGPVKVNTRHSNVKMELQVASLKRISVVSILRLFCEDSNSADAALIKKQLISQCHHELCNEVILKEVVDWYPNNLNDELLCCLVTPSTQSLDVQKCRNVSICGLREALKRCPHLKSLNVSGCSQLAHPLLPKFLGDTVSELKSLNFSDSKDLVDVIVQGILLECKNLEELLLACCDSLTDKAFQFDGNESCSQPTHHTFPPRNIKVIDISGCHQLSSTTVRHFSSISGPFIRKANLSWTNIDCSALLYLAGYSLSSAVFLATCKDGDMKPFSDKELNKAQLFEFQCMHGPSGDSSSAALPLQDENMVAARTNVSISESTGYSLQQQMTHSHTNHQDVGNSTSSLHGGENDCFFKAQLAAQDVPIQGCCQCTKRSFCNHTKSTVPVRSYVESFCGTSSVPPLPLLELGSGNDTVRNVSCDHVFDEGRPHSGLHNAVRPTEEVPLSLLKSNEHSVWDHFNKVLCNCSICLPSTTSSNNSDKCIHSCSCGLVNSLQMENQTSSRGCTSCPPCDQCTILQHTLPMSTELNFTPDNKTIPISNICNNTAAKPAASAFENTGMGTCERVPGPMVWNSLNSEMVSMGDCGKTAQRLTQSTNDGALAFMDVDISVPNIFNGTCTTTVNPTAAVAAPTASTTTDNDMLSVEALTLTNTALLHTVTVANSSKSVRKIAWDNNTQLQDSQTVQQQKQDEEVDEVPWSNNEVIQGARRSSNRDDDLNAYHPIQLYSPNIQELDISEINFYNQNMAVSCTKMFVEANNNLTTLHISWKNLDDEMLEFIVSKERNLKVVSLVDCESLTNTGILSLGKYCTSLVAVDLKGVSFITDQGLQTLIVKGCHLQSLGLAESTISDISLKRMARYCEKQLTHLDLSWCENITDSGVAYIIGNCPNLRALDLRQCDVSTKTFQALAKHVKCLSSLGLCGVNSLTDRHAVAILKNLSNLRDVDLSWNSSLTDESILTLLSYCTHIRNAALAGLKRLTEKPFLPMITGLQQWQLLREKITEDTLQDRGDMMYGRDYAVKEAYHPDFFLPHRSYHYAPSLRRVDLSYCDKVNDIHLAEIIAVCRGTLHIDDYYGEPIRPRWNII